MIWIVITFLPTWIEAFSDRYGESRKAKLKDTVGLIVVAVGIAGGAWWAGYAPLPVIGLILMWRITCFDYLVNAYLKKYHKGHEGINIFKFTGTTSFTDRIVGRIPWTIRLTVRFALLVAMLTSYFLFPIQ